MDAVRGPSTGPFASVESWIVFSSNGDATSDATLMPGDEEIVIEFSSAASAINDADGPLLVIYAWLDSSVLPGGEFEIALDPGATSVLDESGQPIALRLRSGDLDVVAAAAPLELSAEGEDSLPATTARLSVTTQRVLPWLSGYLEFHYPEGIADGLPTVSVDPRYGEATLVVQHPATGVVAIDFQSADMSLNQLPGEVLQVHLALRADAPAGTYPLSIDPGSAQIRDAGGDLVSLDLTSSPLIVGGGVVFGDDFETGDLSRWSP